MESGTKLISTYWKFSADNTRSILEYRKPAEKVMEMYHTEVPKQFAGKGYAKQLVKVDWSKF